MPAIISATRLAMKACQLQMADRDWNCTVDSFGRFEPTPKSGTNYKLVLVVPDSKTCFVLYPQATSSSWCEVRLPYFPIWPIIRLGHWATALSDCAQFCLSNLIQGCESIAIIAWWHQDRVEDVFIQGTGGMGRDSSLILSPSLPS